MKLCWDNIEGFRYNKDTGKFYQYRGNTRSFYLYHEHCSFCQEPFLAQEKSKGKYCSHSCRSRDMNPKVLKGKLASKKTKQKLRLISTKLWQDDKYRQNVLHGLETSDANKEASKRHSLAMTGEENPNWKGGVAYLPYCSTWTKPFKEEIKERDDHHCQNPLCDYPEAPLCVHHIDYQKANCDFDNLITLCIACNSKANYDREWHQAYYTAIMDINRKRRMVELKEVHYV